MPKYSLAVLGEIDATHERLRGAEHATTIHQALKAQTLPEHGEVNREQRSPPLKKGEKGHYWGPRRAIVPGSQLQLGWAPTSLTPPSPASSAPERAGTSAPCLRKPRQVIFRVVLLNAGHGKPPPSKGKKRHH